jgi:glycosyltransferase involved in cell wall biosynthesis
MPPITQGATPSASTATWRESIVTTRSRYAGFPHAGIIGGNGFRTRTGRLVTAISIITVCRNSEHVIRTCLKSVASQTYPHVEHIVIDGASADATCEVVRGFPHVARLVSEPDHGLYDAMNKGIRLATCDVVGILNADDFYPSPSVLATVSKAFEDGNIAATIGDVAFVSPANLRRVTRYYSAQRWNPSLFAAGIMPPHPAFFVRREHYGKLGLYRTDFRISSDFDLLIRFLHTARLPFRYIPGPIVHMRAGGTSNSGWNRRWLLQRETLQACRDNGIPTSHGRLALRYFRKMLEFLPPMGR